MHRRREFICDLLLGLGGNLIVLGMVLILLFLANILPIQSIYGGLFLLLFAAISVLGAVVVGIGLVLDRMGSTPNEATLVSSPEEEAKVGERSTSPTAQYLPQFTKGETQT